MYEICSVRARGPDGVWVGRAGALGPGNRAWSLALASTPAGSARIGSLGDLLPARVLAPLAPAAVLAGVPIAPMTFGATFFSTDAGPSGIRGRGRGRGRGPELHGVEVQLAHPLVGDGRPIVTSGHPPSPGLRQCPTFQKISEAASSAKRVARFDLTLGSQRRPKSRGVWRETVAGCDPESRAARRVRVQRSVHFKR